MCQGMRDVANLAWKLDAVLKARRRRAAEALLDSYGVEREAPRARADDAASRRIGALIGERDAAQGARARRAPARRGGGIVRATRRARTCCRAWRTAALSRADDSRARGTLFPQPWLQRAGRRVRMDDAVGTGWRLVLRDAALRRPTRCCPGLRTLSLPGAATKPTACSRPGSHRHRCAAALVRPDHYVFGTAADTAARARRCSRRRAPRCTDDNDTRPGDRAMRRRHLHPRAGRRRARRRALPCARRPGPTSRCASCCRSRPGSGPDNVARLLGERLGALWGQPVVIDNKPGGQNTIGAQAAARAPADGNTFYFATTAALVTNALPVQVAALRPAEGLRAGRVHRPQPVRRCWSKRNSPLQSLQNFVDKAKAEPGRLTLGNEGPRTFSGMISRVLAARLKIEPNQVPYASIAVATQNLLGGQVEAIVADLASTAALVRSGKLRLLAVTLGAARRRLRGRARRWPRRCRASRWSAGSRSSRRPARRRPWCSA